MATDIGICNSTLTKLGVDHIVSLEDDSRAAKLCKEQYDKKKRAFLVAHPWNFALVRASLALSSTTPAWGYSYQYRLPIDCLRVLTINENEQPWTREGDYILSDSTDCDILYISNVTEGKFSDHAAESLALELAVDLANDLNPQAKPTLMAEMERHIRLSRSFDAQENYPVQVKSRTFTNSRR